MLTLNATESGKETKHFGIIKYHCNYTKSTLSYLQNATASGEGAKRLELYNTLRYGRKDLESSSTLGVREVVDKPLPSGRTKRSGTVTSMEHVLFLYRLLLSGRRKNWNGQTCCDYAQSTPSCLLAVS